MSDFNESSEKIDNLLDKLKSELNSESRLKNELDSYIEEHIERHYDEHANRIESLEKKEKEAQENMEALKKDLLATKEDSLLKISENQNSIQKVEAEATKRLNDSIEKQDAIAREISGNLNALKGDLHVSNQELSDNIEKILIDIQNLDIEVTERLDRAIEKLDIRDNEIEEGLNVLGGELKKMVLKRDFEEYDSTLQKQNVQNHKLFIVLGVISIINTILMVVFLVMNYML